MQTEESIQRSRWRGLRPGSAACQAARRRCRHRVPAKGWCCRVCRSAWRSLSSSRWEPMGVPTARGKGRRWGEAGGGVRRGVRIRAQETSQQHLRFVHKPAPQRELPCFTSLPPLPPDVPSAHPPVTHHRCTALMRSHMVPAVLRGPTIWASSTTRRHQCICAQVQRGARVRCRE